MSLEVIKEKIRKLLALAGNNSSPAEAAAAAGKAAELALEYGLELDKLRLEQPGQKALPIGYKPMCEPSADAEHWLAIISEAVATANGCRFMWYTTVDGVQPLAFGREAAVDTARLTLVYIIESMKATQRRYISELALPSAKLRKEYRTAYRLGYARVVAKRIEAWSDQLSATKGALVVYQKGQIAEVNQWLETQPGLSVEVQPLKSVPRSLPTSAYVKGAADGERVGLGRQVTGSKPTHAGELT